MNDDYFEIDFLAVETGKSGDAISMRYRIDGVTEIHVVDGGYSETGESLINHIKAHYGGATHVHHVVLTHPDSDHACGLKVLLDSDELTVGKLWMNRPWLYAAELLPHFKNYTNANNLAAKLREIYSHTADLEDKAIEKGIPVAEAFQASKIGGFVVMAPTKSRYLELVLDSEKTPERVELKASTLAVMLESAIKALRVTANLVKSAWGEETFSSSGTSRENEMSIIQFARIDEKRLLLTGDAGREALTEAAAYAPWVGLALPGLDRVQVPHHGSRRNVSSEILDTWLGPKLAQQPSLGGGSFTAIVSSAKADPDHPRKSVVRAFQHRGANVYATEGVGICSSSSAPSRSGWSSATALEYPVEQEN
jgi:beta-lactamase superfamily II metal-dependent hydrolase